MSSPFRPLLDHITSIPDFVSPEEEREIVEMWNGPELKALPGFHSDESTSWVDWETLFRSTQGKMTGVPPVLLGLHSRAEEKIHREGVPSWVDRIGVVSFRDLDPSTTALKQTRWCEDVPGPSHLGITLSKLFLQGSTSLTLKDDRGGKPPQTFSLFMPRRSLMTMEVLGAEQSRYGIVAKKADRVNGVVIPREKTLMVAFYATSRCL